MSFDVSTDDIACDARLDMLTAVGPVTGVAPPVSLG